MVHLVQKQNCLKKGAKEVKKLDFKFDTAKTLQSKFLIKDGTFEKQK